MPADEGVAGHLILVWIGTDPGTARDPSLPGRNLLKILEPGTEASGTVYDEQCAEARWLTSPGIGHPHGRPRARHGCYPAPHQPGPVAAPERKVSTVGLGELGGVRPPAVGEMLLEGARLYRRHGNVLTLKSGLVSVPFLLVRQPSIGMASGRHVSAMGDSADASAAPASTTAHGVSAAISSMVVTPYHDLMAVLLYLDQRLRKETVAGARPVVEE